jgi:hypothetical protein
MTIPTITPLPTAPARTDPPATFITRADAFLAAMVTMQTELNTTIGSMNTDIAGVNADAIAAADSASAAASSATAAANAAGAALWVSGQAYAEGDAAISLVNYQTYRAETATSGTTDPSLDANWTAISGTFPDQTANAGKYLTTDGTDPLWDEPIPDQSGNAGKYLTTDGTDASWAAVSAGIIQLQAEENLTAGDLVQLGSSGAVKCKSSQRIQTHAMLLGDGDSYEASFIAYHPVHNYLVSVSTIDVLNYSDVKTWRWNGDRLELVNSTTYPQNHMLTQDFGKMIYDPSSSRIILVNRQVSSDDLDATVFTINADGSASDFNHTTIKAMSYVGALSCAYDANAERVLIAYNENGGASYARVLVIDPSDNSITAGAESISFDTNPTYLSMEYDSTNQVCVAAYKSSSNNGTAVVFTIDPSTNTVTWSTPVVFNSSAADYICLTYDSNNDKLAIFYQYASDLYGVMGYVSSGVTFWGTRERLDTYISTYNVASFNVAENKYYNLSSDSRYGLLRRFRANDNLNGFVEEAQQDYSAQTVDGDEPRYNPRYGLYDDVNKISYLQTFFEDGNGAFSVVAIAAPESQFSTLSTTSLGTASTSTDDNNSHILHLEDYAGGQNSYLFSYTDSSRDLKCRVGTVDFSDGTITLGSEIALNTGTDSNVYAWYDLNINRVVITWRNSTGAISYKMIDVDVVNKTVTQDTTGTVIATSYSSDGYAITYSKEMRKAYAHGYDASNFYVHSIYTQNSSTLGVFTGSSVLQWNPSGGSVGIVLRNEFPAIQIFGRNTTTQYYATYSLDRVPQLRRFASMGAYATNTTGFCYVPEFNILAWGSQSGFFLQSIGGDQTERDTSRPYDSYSNFASIVNDFTNNRTNLADYQNFIFFDKKLSAFLQFYGRYVFIHKWNGEYNNTSLTAVGEFEWGTSDGAQKTGYMAYDEASGCYMSINERDGQDVKIITVKQSAKDGALGFVVESVSAGVTVDIASTGAKYTAPYPVITGANYYVNDYGQITTSGSGTPFAKAISSTELVIK